MAKTGTNISGLKDLYSFQELVVGPHNHVAVAACLEVVKTPGESYNPLFIYGPPGVGKTHLMQAVAHQILAANPGFNVRYISAERFMSEILTAISEDRVLDVRRTYSTLDLLIIDDVQYMTESKISQEELFHVFNNMHQANRQVILAADRPPNQLTTLNKNIQTRLEWGLSTNVTVPDEATRIEILKRKQAQQGLQLTDEMLTHVARSLRSNVRELEGFLKRMHAYVTLSKQKMSMELVQSVIREILPEGTNVEPVAEPKANGAAKPAVAPAVAVEDVRLPDPPKPPAKKAVKEPEPIPIPELEPMPEPPKEEKPKAKAPKAEPMAAKEEVKEPPKETKKAAPAPEPAASSSSVPFDLLLQSIDLGAAHEAAQPEPAKPAAKSAPEKKPPVEAKPAAAVAAKPIPVEVPEPISEEGESEEDGAPGQKEIGAVFFYPEACNEALESVHKKFQDVIKKHKLKFRLKRVHSEPYAFKGKINYSSFVDVCKNNKVPVAIVIGPPPETFIPEQDFYDLLTVTLDVQGVSLQLVNWGEINKDYRYLNLALDIALVRSR